VKRPVRSILRWPLPTLTLSFLAGVALGAVFIAPGALAADEAPEERESPALRQPLPALAAPPGDATDPQTFSVEAPPPPPFDPSYAPPGPVTPDRGTP